MPITLLTAVATLGGLAFLLASLLILANRKLYVYEDPRIDQTEGLLPNANCGGCGYPSCHAFAEALVNKEVLPDKCGVSSDAQRQVLADFLQVSVGDTVKRVARLACAGGNHVATNRADYIGHKSCVAAAQVGGGNKSCLWGCLGLGDCANVCEFGAIRMDRYGLPVVDANKCTACGDCVNICPKGLFSIEPVSHQLWVACKNQEQGDYVLEGCKVGCTACGRCEMDAPQKNICITDHLPVIDYAKSLQGREAIERCPTGAIVWWDNPNSAVKGHEAVKLLNNHSLPFKQI